MLLSFVGAAAYVQVFVFVSLTAAEAFNSFLWFWQCPFFSAETIDQMTLILWTSFLH